MLKLRKITESDKGNLQKWIDSDPVHKGMSAEFYFEPNTESWVVENGEPIFYFRLDHRVIRINMQFGPDRLKTAEALDWGFRLVEEAAKKKKFTELIFDTESRPLKAFCRRRFGFKESPNEQVKRI